MIRSQQLTHAYPGGSALTFPDVEVPQGTGVLLKGPSGSGKSTWLALVAGLIVPRKGALTVAHQPLGALSPVAADAWRAKTIGFLPQKLHLSAALSVRQNLGLVYWAAGRPPDPQRIDAALAALGVQDLAQRLPGQLSGGQAQRVALARAVLLSPTVVLADEPTASLDDEAATEAVGWLLHTAKTQGATLVIATHDARVAALISQNTLDPIDFQPMYLMRQPLLKDEQMMAETKPLGACT